MVAANLAILLSPAGFAMPVMFVGLAMPEVLAGLMVLMGLVILMSFVGWAMSTRGKCYRGLWHTMRANKIQAKLLPHCACK